MNNLTTFYIVRHGQSVANIQQILAGQLDSPLTQAGVNQAKKLSRDLQQVQFDAVFSSDLVRAKRTAEIITLEKKLAIATTKALRERHYGIYEGKSYTEINTALEALHVKHQDLDIEKRHMLGLPSTETIENANSRLITFLREIAVANPGKVILIVCHGGLMRYLLIHLGWAAFATLPIHGISNAGLIVLESDGVDFFVKETKGINVVK